MTEFRAKPHIRRHADGSATVEHRVTNMQQAKAVSAMVAVPNFTSFFGFITESFAGAWQQNALLANPRDLLAYPPIYACVSLIAGDVAKLFLRLTAETADGIWLEHAVAPNTPYLIPLRKPNGYQNRYQFVLAWMVSRLLYGNTYVLKERDNRGMVSAMHVLDPHLVMPLVTPEGDVFYRLTRDWLAGIDEGGIVVPASEMMHDRITPFWHPLVGVGPLYAAAMAGTQGINIQQNSSKFFANMSRPSGILIAPGAISKEQMTAIKEAWDANYGSGNMGKTAVLGDGMKYEPMATAAADAQLTEQLNLSAISVAMAFHVPPYKLGLQSDVKFRNMEQMDVDYYKQCLQTHIESIESTLDEGLELTLSSVPYRTEFDLSGLFRMDPLARAQANQAAIAASYLAPNEARASEDLPPIDGGEEPLSQQQYYPLSSLKGRPTPGATPPVPVQPAPGSEPASAPPTKAINIIDKRARFGARLRKAA